MPKTSIEWTDYSWPVVNGCRRVSAGCGTGREGGCYAERLAATRLKHTDRYRGLAVMTDKGPQWTGETRLIEKELEMPLRLKKPSRIFVADMGDLFFENVPFDAIDRVWAVMLLSPRHTFQVLTKRPARMLEYLRGPDLYDRVVRSADALRRARPQLTQIGISNPATIPPSWIWLGTSVEDQKTADQRIPILLETPAAVRWVSFEPALGPVDFERIQWPGRHRVDVLRGGTWELGGGFCQHSDFPAKIDWIVAGSESGPRARAAELDWFRTVRDQCVASNTSFFFKQWAVNGRKQPVPALDGRQWMQFPEVRCVG